MPNSRGLESDLNQKINSLLAETHINGVLSDIGGAGGLFRPDLGGLEDPVLMTTVNFLGYKLELARQFKQYQGIGIDLVASCVNTILSQGAKPLYFMDSLQAEQLKAEEVLNIVKSVALGCKQSGCALLGGKTGTLNLLQSDSYSLSGFCIGIADNAKIVDGSGIRVGDVLIGLASSGLHITGYNFVLDLLKQLSIDPKEFIAELNDSLQNILMQPSYIYTEAVRNLRRDLPVRGMVYVAKGGLYANIPPILPASVCASLNFNAWVLPPIFDWLQSKAQLSWDEMLQNFNCGLGYIFILPEQYAEEAINRLQAIHSGVWVIGKVELRADKNDPQVHIEY